MGVTIRIEGARLREFELIIKKLGEGRLIQQAMAKGLNEHIRHQEKQAVTMVGAQTGLGRGRVQSISSIRFATPAPAMSAEIQFSDHAISAGSLTSRAWNRGMPGAKHGDWPSYTKKGGMMKGTFMAKGTIFRRTSSARLPIVKVWGPVLPNELLREDMPAYPAAGRLVDADLEKRVIRSVMYAFGF